MVDITGGLVKRFHIIKNKRDTEDAKGRTMIRAPLIMKAILAHRNMMHQKRKHPKKIKNNMGMISVLLEEDDTEDSLIARVRNPQTVGVLERMI